jgi:hypothetical protein
LVAFHIALDLDLVNAFQQSFMTIHSPVCPSWGSPRQLSS